MEESIGVISGELVEDAAALSGLFSVWVGLALTGGRTAFAVAVEGSTRFFSIASRSYIRN